MRGELLTAVGSFAETAGFMAEDDYAHDDACRMYRFALACAEEAGDWHLRAQVLCSMVFQASWGGDPDTGLAYTESTLVRAARLTATERAMLHNSRARGLAKLGEVPRATSAASPNPTRATPKWPTSATASAPWSLPDASRRQAGQVNW